MAPSWQKTTCDSDKTTPQTLVAKNLHLSSSSPGQSRNQQTDYLGMDPEPSACKLKNKTTRSKGIKIKPKRNGDRILGGRRIRKHPSFSIKSKFKKKLFEIAATLGTAIGDGRLQIKLGENYQSLRNVILEEFQGLWRA